jgi:hypothetical protein
LHVLVRFRSYSPNVTGAYQSAPLLNSRDP